VQVKPDISVFEKHIQDAANNPSFPVAGERGVVVLSFYNGKLIGNTLAEHRIGNFEHTGNVCAHDKVISITKLCSSS